MKGADLRAFRERRGWTQDELAAQLGLEGVGRVVTVGRWERGVKSIPSYIARIVQLLEERV